ncbi:uncharacterized protein JCM6883_001046 [Sporobolomyces salmoneus]|uniref:uncharacterized protein n=1 Tax=Sporobolomyces salmoneus TaxID=183962 RepID=UPI0031795A93
MTTKAPPGFPSDVTYITTPVPSRLLPPALKLIYCSPSPPNSLPNPPPRLQIRKIIDPKHPACGQSGLFNHTGKKIERGTWLRDYTGLVHLEKEANLSSDYDLSLERIRVEGTEGGVGGTGGEWETIGIDAAHTGAEARMVNDYRGTGLPRPNALFELRTWQLPNGKGQAKRMAIFAGPHGIEKGSEICVSYGKGFWDNRESS